MPQWLENNHLLTCVKKLKTATKFLWLLVCIASVILVSWFFSNPFALATDYTNTDFILRNPVIDISGGRSTTATYEFYSATGQTAPGESTNSGFTYQAGFLYFGQAVTPPPPPPPPPPPSGPPFAGPPPATAKVIFSGKAYPLATVTLLKDAQIATTVKADADAKFTIELGDLAPGDYIFSIYARDYLGKASKLLLFPVKGIQNQTTTIRNILVGPTLSRDKIQVKQGESILFFGQSLPNADVAISIDHGAFSGAAHTGNDGKYSYSFTTAALKFGTYQVLSTVSDGKKTAESTMEDFTVGNETILATEKACSGKADLNNDCSVDLVDFSILIYWFNKPNAPANIDLDHNGQADLVDFSIMAYYWTG